MIVDKKSGKVVNDKGNTYYFHMKQNEKRPQLVARYFAKDPAGGCSIPDDFEVVTNPKTGMPFAKKIKKP